MEDDKIKELFQAFQPPLSSDSAFLSRLRSSMEAVEIVKRNMREQNRRNRVAVVVAALSGVVVGSLLTLLYPLVGDWISTIDISVPAFGAPSFRLDMSLVYWLAVGTAGVITSLNAYNLLSAKMPIR